MSSRVPLIQNLTEANDVAVAGGKAVNLGELLRAGFPVPGGYVITTHAYRVSRGLTEIPRDVRESAVAAYRGMFGGGTGNVAVRSSATAEDMAGASMAGQYDTFLDIHDEDSLLAAIRACWASIDSPRIRAYLQNSGIPIDKVAMAVVVQKLVPAEIAGVMFTVNPHTGSREEMLIEAAWGLGESVVSGRVQPDVLRIRAGDGKSLEHIVSDKQIMIRPLGMRAKNGALHGAVGHDEEAVPEDRRRVACLEESHIAQLHALGVRAAAHFKRPQDIEWAIADGQLYQLQSRPITTLAGVEAYHDVLERAKNQLKELAAAGRGPWVLHNLAETLPHPTPLTWSVIQPFMSGSGGFGTMYRRAGFAPSELVWKEGFLELVAGRVYMDASRGPEMFFASYPYKYDVEVLRKNPEAGQLPPTVPVGGVRDRLRAGRQTARANARLHELAAGFDGDLEKRTIPQFVAWCAAERKKALGSLSNAELATLWKDRAWKVLGEFAPLSLLPSLIAGVLVEDLREFLAERFWDDDAEELATTLSSPVKADKTLEANAALYKVGLGELAAEAWLGDFGHRGPNEFDLAAPRWRERPLELMTMAGRLRHGPDPAAQHHARAEKIDSLQKKLAARLSANDAARFEELVTACRRYMIYREDGKFFLMLGYALLREAALEIGRRISPKAHEDVFYVGETEMLAALEGKAAAETDATRLRYAAEARLVLPRFVEGAGIETLGNPAADLDASAAKYAAFALSTGSARGTVRIVRDPATAGDLGTDYILVCTSTDPAWTPLFISAAGVVLECGGTLSHGAVVAREMGIPAVVLADATKLLKEGETITVDGHSGAVYRAGESDGAVEHPTPERLDRRDPQNTKVEPKWTPPPAGDRERLGGKIRTWTLVFWAVYLLGAFCLPGKVIYEPSLRTLDMLLWPLVQTVGKPGAVAVIAALMAAGTMIGQYFLSDTRRLREAKRRANVLAQEAAELEPSPRRSMLRMLAAGVQSRVMGATFVPLAVLLGPMIMVFMWLPARIDPSSAAAPAGSDLAILATVDSDYAGPISLDLPAGFHLKPPTPKVLPIRQTLEDYLADPKALQALRETRHDAPAGDLAADLRAYLKALPPQTLTWNLAADDAATEGKFTATLHTEAKGRVITTPIPFVLGEKVAPASLLLDGEGGSVQGIEVRPPKNAGRIYFYFRPITLFKEHPIDPGWITVYLLVYIPAMLALKFLLRLP
jgi:rifampicin phosphotransferase